MTGALLKIFNRCLFRAGFIYGTVHFQIGQRKNWKYLKIFIAMVTQTIYTSSSVIKCGMIEWMRNTTCKFKIIWMEYMCYLNQIPSWLSASATVRIWCRAALAISKSRSQIKLPSQSEKNEKNTSKLGYWKRHLKIHKELRENQNTLTEMT